MAVPPQHHPPSGRQQPHHPAADLPDAFLDPGQPGWAEPGRQCGRRGRRRRGHRGQGFPSRVSAAAVQMSPKVGAEHLRLRQRHQKLPGGNAAVPLLDRSDSVVEGLDHTQPPDQLRHRHHARGQGSATRPVRRCEPAPPNPVSCSPNGCLPAADDSGPRQAQSSLLARHPFVMPRRCWLPIYRSGSDRSVRYARRGVFTRLLYQSNIHNGGTSAVSSPPRSYQIMPKRDEMPS